MTGKIKTVMTLTISSPTPLVVDGTMAKAFAGSITRVLIEGFWFCYGCDRLCEREEGEHGQPAHCQRCGSHVIEWHPPAYEISNAA